MDETEQPKLTRPESARDQEKVVRKPLSQLPRNQAELNDLIAQVQLDTLQGIGGFGNIITAKRGYDELVAAGRDISPELMTEVVIEQDRRLDAFNTFLGSAISATHHGPIEVREDAKEDAYATFTPAMYETPKNSGHTERLAQVQEEKIALLQAIASGKVTDLEQLAAREAEKLVGNEEAIILLQEQITDLQAQIKDMASKNKSDP